MLIFGSTALKYWFSDFSREPHDLDIICNKTSPSVGVDVLWFDGIELLLKLILKKLKKLAKST